MPYDLKENQIKVPLQLDIDLSIHLHSTLKMAVSLTNWTPRVVISLPPIPAKNDLQHPSTPVHHMHPPCKIQGAECFASFSKMPLDWTCTNLKKNMAMMGDLFSTSNRAPGGPRKSSTKKNHKVEKFNPTSRNPKKGIWYNDTLPNNLWPNNF